MHVNRYKYMSAEQRQQHLGNAVKVFIMTTIGALMFSIAVLVVTTKLAAI